MRKIIFLLLFCFAFGLLGFSQAAAFSTLRGLSDQFTFEKSKMNALDDINIEGSPYLNKEFILGEIVADDSIRFEKIPLRYNIYSDKIEFKDDKEQILELDMSRQTYNFKLGNLWFAPLDYLDNGNKKNGILEVMVEGNIRLYKKYLVDFKPATKAAGYQDAKPDRFIRMDDEYLIAAGSDMPETVRISKKLFERLKQFKPDIEQYAKSKGLKIKSESGLIQLIQYCNN